MLKETRTDEKYDEALNKALDIVKAKGFDDIKADCEGYETPAAFQQQESETSYTPDITATKNDRKFYFEIAKKTDEQDKLISKWKLLSMMSKIKNGSFHILVPYGQMKFTRELVTAHNIDANLIKMS